MGLKLELIKRLLTVCNCMVNPRQNSENFKLDSLFLAILASPFVFFIAVLYHFNYYKKLIPSILMKNLIANRIILSDEGLAIAVSNYKCPIRTNWIEFFSGN